MSQITDSIDGKSKESKLQHLVGPTDPKIDAEARERLVTARISLLMKHSFFGNLATRLQLINADEWCPTAATDGKYFYYNSRFIMMLKQPEVVFLVAHEVLHVVYDHMDRRGDRDPQLWNIADDYCVNADLKKHRVGEFITTVPCLYDHKYADMPAEEVYDILYENAEKISIDQLAEMLLDEHLEGEGEGSAEGENEGEEGKKGPVKMSKEEKDQLKQEIKEAILNSAQAAGAGNTPAGVQRMIKQFTNPVMPWSDLLNTNLTSTLSSDYSFQRVSRRSWHMDAILPGMIPGEMIDVDIFLDMSGSIGYDQGTAFLSEVKSIMETFTNYVLRVHCFDTQVYNYAEFTSDNLEDIEEYEIMGGGGTDFDCIFNYLKEEGRVPNRLIVFTDGYPFGSWGDSNYCDTTWIIHGDPDPNPPFGTYAIYDDHKRRKAA